MKATLAVLALGLAMVAALPVHEVENLEDHGGMALGEGVGVSVFLKNGKMWHKADKRPAGSVERKMIPDVEKEGKCRFACYQDKLCGGYSFVFSDHTCTLLSAPNFLVSKGANDAWHREAVESTGAAYKPDTVEKEKNNIKKAISQQPKIKSKAAPPKPGEYGALPMRLEHVMNNALVSANMADPEGAKDASLSETMMNELNKYRAKLYNEFYEKYAHEFEIRAERHAKAKAEKKVQQRVKKAKVKHPNSKISHAEQVKLYLQARKEVDNHTVRKYQRKFTKHLEKWAANKVFTEQERLKKNDEARKRDDQLIRLDKRREENEAKLKGKDPPAKEEVMPAAKEVEKGPDADKKAPQ